MKRCKLHKKELSESKKCPRFRAVKKGQSFFQFKIAIVFKGKTSSFRNCSSRLTRSSARRLNSVKLCRCTPVFLSSEKII